MDSSSGVALMSCTTLRVFCCISRIVAFRGRSVTLLVDYGTMSCLVFGRVKAAQPPPEMRERMRQGCVLCVVKSAPRSQFMPTLLGIILLGTYFGTTVAHLVCAGKHSPRTMLWVAIRNSQILFEEFPNNNCWIHYLVHSALQPRRKEQTPMPLFLEAMLETMVCSNHSSGEAQGMGFAAFVSAPPPPPPASPTNSLKHVAACCSTARGPLVCCHR